MMKTILLLPAFLFLYFSVCAQIQFSNGLAWDQVKSKAKAENKLIFIDAFTTWCAPCKKMDQETYPDAKTGEYFNKKFVSVKVQMDRTAGDNAEVKSWYAVANEIKSKYKIMGYPSLIFVNGDGELIYQAIGFKMPLDLLEEGRNAAEPGKLEADKKALEFYQNILEPFLRTYPDWKQIKMQLVDHNINRSLEKVYEKIARYYLAGISEGTASGNLVQAVESLRKLNSDILTAEFLNMAAYEVFKISNDKRELSRAIVWSKSVIDRDQNPGYLDTYASLLYRTGRKSEAISWQEKAAAAGNFADIKSALELMKKNLPIMKSFGTPVKSRQNKWLYFTGQWLLDTIASEFNGVDPLKSAPTIIKLTQATGSIIFERDFNGLIAPVESLTFNGAEKEFSLQNSRVKRSSVWSVDKSILTVFSIYEVSPDEGKPYSFTREETYTLRNAGKSLLLSRVTITPDGKVECVKAFYRKM